MIPFLDLARQYRGIKSELDEAIAAVIREGAFIGGKYVKTFEERFAAYQEAGCCVGVANGTDAIEIALEALALPPGSEVLVPANGFIASSEAVTRSGHRVVFCDCDSATYTICAEDAKRKVSSRTKAIVAVHLYGHPCDMDALRALADRHGLRIIEDCAQAHGARYKGRRVGVLGDIGTFSFYPGKNLGAYGDGGAIVTNDGALARRMRMIANHGRVDKYNHEFEGRNSRLDGLQAAILAVKLEHLDGWIQARRATAARYERNLKEARELFLPSQASWADHVWHLYVVRTSKRNALRDALEKSGIQTGIHYPIALPKLEAYEYLDQAAEPMLANRLDGDLLSLPMGDHLTEAEVDAVSEAVLGFFRGRL